MTSREDFMELASQVLHGLDDLLRETQCQPITAQSPTVPAIRDMKELVIAMRDDIASAVPQKRREKNKEVMEILTFFWPDQSDLMQPLGRLHDIYINIE